MGNNLLDEIKSGPSFPAIKRIDSDGKEIEYNWGSPIYDGATRVALLLGFGANHRESKDMDVSTIEIDEAIKNSPGFVEAYIVGKVLGGMNTDPKNGTGILKYELQIAYSRLLKEPGAFRSYLDWRIRKFKESENTDLGIEINWIRRLMENMDPEANKNKLDLKPNIDFVSKNLELYETGLQGIMKKPVGLNEEKWGDQIKFSGEKDIVNPQISPEQAREILIRMPPPLIALSKLKTINYHTYGNIGVIPVPGFDEKGNLEFNKITLVPVKDFPRKGDHPSRILVGLSDGETIYPTPIPRSVSEDAKAVHMYQIHVLLHEFFHTIDYPRRGSEERKKVILETDGRQFTFQDWWIEFENLILSDAEPLSVSMYADTYGNDLSQETKNADYGKFSRAIGEQICESFVAYQLNIISNNKGWTDFQSESFGNTSQGLLCQNGESKSANIKWLLMDKLCRATVLSQDNP